MVPCFEKTRVSLEMNTRLGNPIVVTNAEKYDIVTAHGHVSGTSPTSLDLVVGQMPLRISLSTFGSAPRSDLRHHRVVLPATGTIDRSRYPSPANPLGLCATGIHRTDHSPFASRLDLLNHIHGPAGAVLLASIPAPCAKPRRHLLVGARRSSLLTKVLANELVPSLDQHLIQPLLQRLFALELPLLSP